MPDEPFLTSSTGREERPYPHEGMEHRRLGISGFFKFLLVLVSLAVFAGVIWYAFRSGGPATEEPLTISARDEPHRTRPEEPGGEQVAHQDKQVFGTAIGQDQQETGISLAPPAEEPVDVPEPVAAPETSGSSESEAVEASQPESAGESAAVLSRPPGAGAAPEATDDVEIMLPPGDEQVARDESPPAPQASEQTGGYDMFADAGAPVEQDQPAPQSEPAADPQPEPEPQDATSASPPARQDDIISGSTVSVDWSKAFLVQIGAFQELETAEDAWNAARRRFADIMQDKAANIRQVEIPGRGTWYRVRIGPYDSRPAAEVACTDLKERGQDCLVVAP